MTEPETPTTTWVADRGTAWSAAYAMTLADTQAPRFRIFALVVVVGLPTFLVKAGQGGAAFLLLMGLALAVFLLAGAILISAWGRQRRYRLALPPGLALSTQFGDDFFLIHGPYSETRQLFDGFDRINVVAGWVLLRQRHRRVVVLFPQALFPRHDLARLRLTILGHAPG